MRAVLAILLAAACTQSSADKLTNGTGMGSNGNGTGGADAPAQCATDNDCALAAARCCDCPTFAMMVDPATNICAGVTCPMPGINSCPTNIHAACVQTQCELACNVVQCDQQCPDGFAIDSNGCTTCSCAAVTSRSCTTGSDCSEVPADCCGCALGGSDTAVPSSQVASWETGLDCPPSPSCPGVSTCDTSETPACVQGACALAPPLPANACGRPDLAACGSGMICALNADPQATAQGVGVCVPAA
jgi:hypothetical protein